MHRRNLPHIQARGRPHFITFRTRDRLILAEPAREAVLAHCTREHEVRMQLHAAVVMPDHVHLLVTPLSDDTGEDYALSRVLHSIKGASSHTVNRVMHRTGSVWQDESYDHVLRRNEDLRRVAEYICQNPVGAGLVESEDGYRWLWREWVEGAG